MAAYVLPPPVGACNNPSYPHWQRARPPAGKAEAPSHWKQTTSQAEREQMDLKLWTRAKKHLKKCVSSNNIWPTHPVLVVSTCIFGMVCVSMQAKPIEAMNIFSRPSLLASISFLLILCTGVTLDAQGQRNRND